MVSGAGSDGTATKPTSDEVEAVMLAAQLLVAVTAQSIAAIEDEVSLPQFRVLVIVHNRGPQGLNAVAKSLDVHPSNATRACDKLVETGLLSRSEDPEDRRRLRLDLTDRGRRLVEGVLDRRRQQIEELLNLVPGDERRHLVRVLRSLVEAGEQIDDQPAWTYSWSTPTRRRGTTNG